MRALFLRLFLALALAWSGSAAQLHSLAHAQYDLAAAGHGGKAPAPLKHSSEQCLVVHALDATAVEPGALLAAECYSEQVAPSPVEQRSAVPGLAFRARAPPRLS